MHRLIASVYDGFLLFAVLFAAAALYGWLHGNVVQLGNSELEAGTVVHELKPIAEGWLYRLYLALVIILFYTAFWCKSGQTLGMQAWRIKVQTVHGEIMSVPQGMLRACLGLLFIGVGMLWIPFNKGKQSLYDKLTRTEVVQLEKPKK